MTPEEMIVHLLEICEQLKEIDTAKEEPLEQPERFASLAELDAYIHEREERHLAQEKRDEERQTLKRELSEIEKALKGLILPVKNSYVRIGNHGVAVYLEAWGGDHYEISVVPWQDDLKPCSDRTYYP